MPADPARQERIEEIFHELLATPDDRRAERVRALCGGDASMEREVAELVRCLGSAPPQLETPVVAVANAAAVQEGERLGAFRILRLLGEGGMGQVYEAQQEFPSRRIALKVIRAGMASEPLARRFEFEATALAQLRHPGIAQIYEAGFFEAGGVLAGKRPYFAMELIEGQRLDGFAPGLSPDRVLGIVAAIADAVHHAHQRGIIHRDLKPGNILVEGEGSTARPKILDFGVARLTPEAGAERTQVTETGQMIGTVAYMAPEQIVGGEVDTRCDVYALGVILYQLLAGRLPHPTEKSSLLEAARIISGQDPPSLGSVRREFRGDISTIVAKAMDRDRERRYGSAAEFAADLRCFMAHEPIQARPATAGYLARRFARRHRVLVGSAALLAVTILASSVGMGVLYKREQRQHGIADAALARSTREIKRQKATLSLLVDDAFGAAAPAKKGMGLRVVDVLDDAIAAVPARFPDDPGMRAHLWVHLSNLLCATAQHSKAVPILQRAFAEAPPEDVDTRLGARLLLGYCDAYQGRFDSALANFKEAVALGPDAGPELAGSVEEAKLGVGQMLQTLGRLDEAEPILRSIIATEQSGNLDRPDRPTEARLALVTCLSQRPGRGAEVEQLLRDAVAWIQDKHLEASKTGLSAMHNWAGFLMAHGKETEAVPIALEVRETAERMYPPNHINVAMADMIAGEALVVTGRTAQGTESFRKGMNIIETTNDETQFVIEQVRGRAIKLFTRAGDTDGVKECFRGWLRCRLLTAGAGEGKGVVARTAEYRKLLTDNGASSEQADAFLDEFVEDCRSRYGPESLRRPRLLANAARGLLGLDRTPVRCRLAADLLKEARAALPHSTREGEDASLIQAVEEELAAGGC